MDGWYKPEAESHHEIWNASHPQKIQSINHGDGGQSDIIMTDSESAEAYAEHMRQGGHNAEIEMVGPNKYRVKVLPSAEMKVGNKTSDDASMRDDQEPSNPEETVKQIVDDIEDPNSKSQVDPDKIPASIRDSISKYEAHEVAYKVLKKAEEMIAAHLEKARIDEGKTVGAKIESRSQRNQRNAVAFTQPHPADKRLGSEEIAAKLVGTPKATVKVNKCEKLGGFIKRISDKRLSKGGVLGGIAKTEDKK